MAESDGLRRDYVNSGVTLVTVVVGVWSLYYSGVQAEVARKTLSLTYNEAQAKLQTDLAGIQKQLAASAPDGKQGEVLSRVADLQTKLAEQQKQFASCRTDEQLAGMQQALGQVQHGLARVQQEQEQKDRELASLRVQLAEAKRPPVSTTTLNSTSPFPRLLTRSPDSLISIQPPRVPFKAQFPIATAVDQPDETWLGWAKTKLLELWSLVCQYPAPSIYFGLALGWTLTRVLGGK
jgi:hypothetical protein